MQRIVARSLATILAAIAVCAGAQAAEPSTPAGQAPCRETRCGGGLCEIDRWIVIYQENWSFDGLYGEFPGAEGLDSATAAIVHVDKRGKPLAALPSPSTDSNIPPGLPARPYDLSPYVPTTSTTKDLVHSVYKEQMQIDNGLLEPSAGCMDKFVSWKGR